MPNLSFEFIIMKPEEDDYTTIFLKCITLKLLKDVYTLDTLDWFGMVMCIHYFGQTHCCRSLTM